MREQRVGGRDHRQRIVRAQWMSHPAPGDAPEKRAPGAARRQREAGADDLTVLAEPEQILEPASESAGEIQGDGSGRLGAPRFERAEGLPADSRPRRQLALPQATALARAAQAALERRHPRRVTPSTAACQSPTARHPAELHTWARLRPPASSCAASLVASE